MPFERYLRPDADPAISNSSDLYRYYQDYRHAYDDADCHFSQGQHPYLPEAGRYDHHHPHAVQFQIPHFMLNGPPILAPGGGAEVLPAGLLDRGLDSFASSWFANNGFTPFHSSLISRQIISDSSLPDNAGSYHTLPPDTSQGTHSSFPYPRQQRLSESPTSLEAATTYIPDPGSSSTSAGSSNAPLYALSDPTPTDPPSVPVTAPSALGFPVYSASGFDVLSILSRVVHRHNPTIQLGPVDLSCSFVIVDVRRHDSPIVYASPTFCHLTGYNEQEVLGRNCRFLQSPTGNVTKGEPRRFVSPEAVSHMRKLLSSSKECQTTLINYRKGGQAFINHVTVIPLCGGVNDAPEEADEVAYHIGFQVDLTEQPNRIKLRDGSYHSANSNSWPASGVAGPLPGASHALSQLTQVQNMTNIGPKGGRHGQMMSIAVSKELRSLIADTTFTDLVPISTGTNMSGPAAAPSGSTDHANNATTPLTMLVTPPSGSTSMSRISANSDAMSGSIPVSLSPSLSLLLLEFLPDFLLVLSLKGAFLYVAPSVRLVLGYEPQELVGRSISDVCHPADLVPLMRELKEGSMSGLGVSGTGDAGSAGATSNLLPKSVDLLFRALPKVPSVSSSKKTQDTSAQHDGTRPSQSSPASTFAPQSSSLSGSLCSNERSDEAEPPYVWLECRGRLHVEPGKGRKAIILSGRARWMPVVRWGSIEKAGGVNNVRCQGGNTLGGSHMTAGPNLREASMSEATGAKTVDQLEFWSLLSTQGTFLVASASVRDVLGWGTSEMIGRNIWAMTRDSRSGVRDLVEAELTKLDTTEGNNAVDPSPTIVTTSLVHKQVHTVPVRLAFYRTPRSRLHVPPSTSAMGVKFPLIHSLNNPLCPIVCQVTVLSNTEYQSNNNIDSGFSSCWGHVSNKQSHMDIEGNADQTEHSRSADASLYEELETVRGSSWQYELQQLKFANQRLHEELSALESACANSVPSSGSPPGATETVHLSSITLAQPCSSSSTATIPMSSPLQSQLHYTPLMHSSLPPSLPSLRPPNTLHDQDPPSSEWSSLAGANGQPSNPLKRTWRSEDRPTT